MDLEKLPQYKDLDPAELSEDDRDSVITTHHAHQPIYERPSSQFRKTLRDVAIGFLIATALWTIPKATRVSWPTSQRCLNRFFGHRHHHHHGKHHHHQHGKHHHWFPSGKEVGYEGPTEDGIEPFAAVTSPVPIEQQSYFPLVSPVQSGSDHHAFNPIRSWGYLSPFHSLPAGTFGLEKSSGQIPRHCKLKQVHLLHRHGARYPTSSKEPAGFADRLLAAGKFKATGKMEFLNTWGYALGKEVLTPFGRSQLFNLGVGFRQKYGHLLYKMAPKEKLVFRTTSQNRMLDSAVNFAAGFFGLPFKSKYHQSIIIEEEGFNNTLAPYKTCKNSKRADQTFASSILSNWTEIYLKETLPRLQADLTGYKLTFKDVFSMQQLCAYETVSLGWSPFCQLFTPEEFKGFAYHSDLMFWYAYSFGSPYAAAIGKGWVQELLSRLTQKPIAVFDSTTNSTLDSNPITFPLSQPIYVDATHDTVISCIVVALNLTSLASEGPLPTDRIPSKRSFISSEISPFAANLQSQVVECDGSKKIRFLLNDAPVPLTGLHGCPTDSDGFCPLEIAVKALKTRVDEINYEHDCNADLGYSPPAGGGGIVDGRPPAL